MMSIAVPRLVSATLQSSPQRRLTIIHMPILHVAQLNAAAALEQELPPSVGVLLLEAACVVDERLALHVVEHDDVCASLDGLACLLHRLHLDVDAQREAGDAACGGDGGRDGS